MMNQLSISRRNLWRATLALVLCISAGNNHAQSLPPAQPPSAMTIQSQVLGIGSGNQSDAAALDTFSLYIDCISGISQAACKPGEDRALCNETSRKDSIALAFRKDRKQALVESSSGILASGSRVQLLETGRTYILTTMTGNNHLSMAIDRQTGRLEGREKEGFGIAEGKVIATYQMTCKAVKEVDLPKPKI